MGARTDGAVPKQAAPERVEVDLSHHFRTMGADGAFLFHDMSADRILVHNPERAGRGFLPASTFKILNSLIALETGVLRKPHVLLT
jgi:beta-lactamase class D